MGSNDHHKQGTSAPMPSLEALIKSIDSQIDQMPHPHAVDGFENFWGSQVGEYRNPDQQSIRFELAGFQFAISLLNAVEIDYLPEITPLPKLPHWVLGITSLRGDIVSVVDLKPVLDLASEGQSAIKKLILIRNQDFSTAIVVDKIHGMLSEDENPKMAEHRTKAKPSFSGFVQGYVEINRQTVYLLNVDRVMKALEVPS